MLTTIDKAWVAGVVSWLVNSGASWLGLTAMPTEVTAAAAALITAIFVWWVPNKRA
jgi:hypothetical protein